MFGKRKKITQVFSVHQNSRVIESDLQQKQGHVAKEQLILFIYHN